MAVQDNTANVNGRNEHAQEVGEGSAPDHVQRLRMAVAKALKQRSRTEPVIVSRMQERADLYEKAVVQAKPATVDGVAHDAAPARQQARQVDALHKPEVEVLPVEMVVKLAALDARQYGKLQDPGHRVSAVLAMADIARHSAEYRVALANHAPNVSSAVESTITVTATAKRDGTTQNAKPSVTPGPQQSNASSDPIPKLETDPLERAQRARGAKAVPQQLLVNSIEQVIERTQQTQREAQPEPRRTLDKAPEVARQPRSTRPQGSNQVIADEVFTASKIDAKLIVPAEVEDTYLRVGSKFYHPKSTHVVAFEDKGNKLETRSNSAQIATAMVAIARARGWDEIKVAGSETFRKEVWLEAATHGMHVKGYTPSDVDKAELAKRHRHAEVKYDRPHVGTHERESRTHAATPSNAQAPSIDKIKQEVKMDEVDRRQPATQDQQRAKVFAQRSPADAVAMHPELAGAYAAMASIQKKVAADPLSPEQRAVVMARVEANLVNSIERGQLPEMKLRETQVPLEVRHERGSVKERAR